MMEEQLNFSRDELLALAEACHIALSEEEVEEYLAALRGMIGLASHLREADVSQKPYRGIREATLAELREDLAKEGLPRELLLRGAPDAKDGFFRVPRTVEE